MGDSTYNEQAARAAAPSPDANQETRARERRQPPRNHAIVHQNGIPTDKHGRKCCPVKRGVLDYFPDAIAAVANVSFVGNEQHNPGEPMHWARGKSNDHEDCAVRHLMDPNAIDDDNLRHKAKAAWRVLAALQLEIEAAKEKK